ncbi:MAG TPA: succinate dehydrogenase cytochrome b subunit [Oligoflexia bacterium]|nr:succinate dehydrogenase cytochrome b subunit [Oligoflexia bacterium]HMP49483.1 succinate dehydrogenase cytochrome b subunit [Oligoflexia bacterium]
MIVQFYSTSIGKKVVMALTGVMLLGFVVMHLLGNLQVFLGADEFNSYAAFLKSIPGPLWVARLGLIFVFLLHIITAFKLRSINKTARPHGYREMDTRVADPASLYMLQTGIVVLLFVVLHLLHFTFGLLQPEFYTFVDSEGRHDVYKMIVNGFKSGPYSYLYMVAMLAVGYHLSHGFWSMFQTLGVNSPRLTPFLKNAARGLAALVAFGYISIPLAVLTGILN